MTHTPWLTLPDSAAVGERTRLQDSRDASGDWRLHDPERSVVA